MVNHPEESPSWGCAGISPEATLRLGLRVARLWHERPGNVIAFPDLDLDTPFDQDVSPWALVGSNHRPPPC
jgi:hypothetical protein